MEELYKCSRCNCKKPDSEYERFENGQRKKLCAVCSQKARHESKARRTGEYKTTLLNPEAPAESISLNIFLNIPKRAGRSWTLGQAEYLAQGLAEYVKSGQAPDYKKLAAKYGSGHALGACKGLITELRRAAADPKKIFRGKIPSIKEYFDGGRKYSPANEVLFDASKKKK